MSTKIPVASVDGITLFKDCFDEQNCFLQFDTCSMEAFFTEKGGQVTVTIPIHVWEFLRTLPATDQNLVAKTDQELRTEIEALVDERIADLKAGKKIISGMAFFGSPETPRADQIQRALAESFRQREAQRQIVAKTGALISQHAAKD